MKVHVFQSAKYDRKTWWYTHIPQAKSQSSSCSHSRNFAIFALYAIFIMYDIFMQSNNVGLDPWAVKGGGGGGRRVRTTPFWVN